MLEERYPRIFEYENGRKVSLVCDKFMDYLCFERGILEEFRCATDDFYSHFDNYWEQLDKVVQNQLKLEFYVDVIDNVNSEI